MEFIYLALIVLCGSVLFLLSPHLRKISTETVFPETEPIVRAAEDPVSDDEDMPLQDSQTLTPPPSIQPIKEWELRDFEAVESLWHNKSESAMFVALHKAMPFGFHIHGKVRLEDIIQVRATVQAKSIRFRRGRVKSRHVDYLVTNNKGRPMLCVELDGAVHDADDPSESDKVKTALFVAAGIPLHRVRVGENFDHIAATICAELKAS